MAFYVEANQIMAVAACGFTQELIAIEELMRLFELPSADILQKKIGRLGGSLKATRCRLALPLTDYVYQNFSNPLWAFQRH